jgi:hypothetical protein
MALAASIMGKTYFTGMIKVPAVSISARASRSHYVSFEMKLVSVAPRKATKASPATACPCQLAGVPVVLAKNPTTMDAIGTLLVLYRPGRNAESFALLGQELSDPFPGLRS